MVSRSDLDEIQAQLKISIQNHQVSEPCQLFGGYILQAPSLPHFREIVKKKNTMWIVTSFIK